MLKKPLFAPQSPFIANKLSITTNYSVTGYYYTYFIFIDCITNSPSSLGLTYHFGQILVRNNTTIRNFY